MKPTTTKEAVASAHAVVKTLSDLVGAAMRSPMGAWGPPIRLLYLLTQANSLCTRLVCLDYDEPAPTDTPAEQHPTYLALDRSATLVSEITLLASEAEQMGIMSVKEALTRVSRCVNSISLFLMDHKKAWLENHAVAPAVILLNREQLAQHGPHLNLDNDVVLASLLRLTAPADRRGLLNSRPAMQRARVESLLKQAGVEIDVEATCTNEPDDDCPGALEPPDPPKINPVLLDLSRRNTTIEPFRVGGACATRRADPVFQLLCILLDKHLPSGVLEAEVHDAILSAKANMPSAVERVEEHAAQLLDKLLDSPSC